MKKSINPFSGVPIKKLCVRVLLCLAPALILAAIVFVRFLIYNEDTLRSQGLLSVKASVTEIETHRIRKSTFNHYYVSYEIGGLEYNSELSGDIAELSEGDTLTAYYDPDNPLYIVRPQQSETLIHNIIWITVFAVIGIVLFFILSIKSNEKDRKKLQK